MHTHTHTYDNIHTVLHMNRPIRINMPTTEGMLAHSNQLCSSLTVGCLSELVPTVSGRIGCGYNSPQTYA